jgi:hypothetical protein
VKALYVRVLDSHELGSGSRQLPKPLTPQPQSLVACCFPSSRERAIRWWPPKEVERFFEDIEYADKTVHVYPGSLHEPQTIWNASR